MLTEPETVYDPAEQSEILDVFRQLMWPVVADGGRKRAARAKPHWTVDPDHLNALERHLHRYDMGERVDADSGAHPMVHVAARALMLAWQETR